MDRSHAAKQAHVDLMLATWQQAAGINNAVTAEQTETAAAEQTESAADAESSVDLQFHYPLKDVQTAFL